MYGLLGARKGMGVVHSCVLYCTLAYVFYVIRLCLLGLGMYPVIAHVLGFTLRPAQSVNSYSFLVWVRRSCTLLVVMAKSSA